MNKVATNQGQDCKVLVNLPGYLKYSVAIMPLVDTQRFQEAPNERWLKRDTLVPEKDITRVFDEIMDNNTGFIPGPISFVPTGFEGVKVYFDASRKDSLFIVAESEEIADDYAENIRLSRKPYNIPKSRGRPPFPYLQ